MRPVLSSSHYWTALFFASDGIGHIAGSLLSGKLSEYVHVTTVAILASSLCFLVVGVNAILLTSARSSPSADKSSGLEIGKALTMLKSSSLRLYMLFQLLVGACTLACVRVCVGEVFPFCGLRWTACSDWVLGSVGLLCFQSIPRVVSEAWAAAAC